MQKVFNKAIVEQDLVIGLAWGDMDGVTIPEALIGSSFKMLRYVDEEIVDVSGRVQWWVDEDGRLHVAQHDTSWSSIDCNWDDTLVQDENGKWVVFTEKDRLKKEAGRVRWSYETAGVEVPSLSNLKVSSDTEAQAKIGFLNVAFAAGSITGTVPFKARSGWIDVGQADVAVIHAAVFDHVQQCYAVEKSVVAAIDQGTVTDEEGVEAQPWPGKGV